MEGAWGFIIAAAITGIFGVIIGWQNFRLGQKVKTNHGKNIGEHLEEVGIDIKTAAVAAEQARVTGQLVALELSQYKIQQANEAAAVKLALENNDTSFKLLLAAHTADDSRRFSELRSLLVQGLALSPRDPTS